MAVENQGCLQRWIATLLGGLLFVVLAIAAVSYLSFSMRFTYQKYFRDHAEAEFIIKNYPGLQSISLAHELWEVALSTAQAGVLGPAIVEYVESSRLYRFVTMRTWVAAGFFGGSSLLCLWLVITNASSIIFAVIKNRRKQDKNATRLSSRLEKVFFDPEVRAALTRMPVPAILGERSTGSYE
jgi:hypothetical protein